MEADFGAEELALIIAAFQLEATEALAALRAGWMDDHIRHDRLHFLKGCARTVGAVRLGDLCEAFEAATVGPEDCRLLEREFHAACEVLSPERFRAAG